MLTLIGIIIIIIHSALYSEWNIHMNGIRKKPPKKRIVVDMVMLFFCLFFSAFLKESPMSKYNIKVMHKQRGGMP